MEELELLVPTLEYAEDIWCFKHELEQDTDPFRYDGVSTLITSPSAAYFVEHCCVKEKDPDGKVPSTLYLCVRKEDYKIVGMIDFRHHIDHPILSTYGGHFGYVVRPNERHKGYGTKMLAMGLAKAKEFGLTKVLITCQTINTGSQKVITNNGGIFESIVMDEDRKIERCWITL